MFSQQAKGLLSILSVFNSDDTILTAEEEERIERRKAEYKANPSVTIPLDDIIAEYRQQGIIIDG